LKLLTLCLLIGEISFGGLKFLVDVLDVFSVGFEVGVALLDVLIDAISKIAWADDDDEQNCYYCD